MKMWYECSTSSLLTKWCCGWLLVVWPLVASPGARVVGRLPSIWDDLDRSSYMTAPPSMEGPTMPPTSQQNELSSPKTGNFRS